MRRFSAVWLPSKILILIIIKSDTEKTAIPENFAKNLHMFFQMLKIIIDCAA
jgi:hypothetical protein